MPRHLPDHAYVAADFACPLSKTVMANPAELPCGHSFETASIEQHFALDAVTNNLDNDADASCKCPVTFCQEPFLWNQIIPNIPLERQIDTFVAEQQKLAPKDGLSSFWEELFGPPKATLSSNEIADFKQRRAAVDQVRKLKAQEFINRKRSEVVVNRATRNATAYNATKIAATSIAPAVAAIDLAFRAYSQQQAAKEAEAERIAQAARQAQANKPANVLAIAICDAGRNIATEQYAASYSQPEVSNTGRDLMLVNNTLDLNAHKIAEQPPHAALVLRLQKYRKHVGA